MSIDQVPGARADAIGEVIDGHTNAGVPQSESATRPHGQSPPQTPSVVVQPMDMDPEGDRSELDDIRTREIYRTPVRTLSALLLERYSPTPEYNLVSGP